MTSILIIILIILSLITFLLFGMDKRKAAKHKWRIPEATLLLFSVFGGIGGLMGMLFFRHKTRKWKFRILVPLFAVIDTGILVFLLWASVYYHAGEAAALAMQSDNLVSLEKTRTGWMFDGPSDDKVLIFYPGAKVEETAYAPLLHELAAKEMDVCLIKMPLRLAFFGIYKADRVIEEGSYNHYYIGGHSLGGAMAAGYAAENEDDIEGVILLAAYPPKETTADTVLIYGSEDGVLNMSRVEGAKNLVSGAYAEYVINGGNHAQFGSYGAQAGDGKAEITAEEQWDLTVREIVRFLEEEKKHGAE